MSVAFADYGVREYATARAPSKIALSWERLRSRWTRWAARQSRRRAIAHLDGRLLADVGLCSADLGWSERLIRRYPCGYLVRAV
jgi:uncharacterized protein YjiS (DUF1127 family)